MKKISILSLALIMLLSFSACEFSIGTNDNNSKMSTPFSKKTYLWQILTYKIGDIITKYCKITNILANDKNITRKSSPEP